MLYFLIPSFSTGKAWVEEMKHIFSFLFCLPSVATVTVVVGMIQMRELEFVPDGNIELDNILLLIAQTGVYIYTSFSIIGGHFTMSVSEIHCPLFLNVVTVLGKCLEAAILLSYISMYLLLVFACSLLF